MRAITLDLFGRRIAICLMIDSDEPQARIAQPGMADDFAIAGETSGAEASFVEKIGSECADVRVKPPRFRQQQPHRVGNRLVVAEQMLQCRTFRARRMASLQRAVELLRVADQDDIFATC